MVPFHNSSAGATLPSSNGTRPPTPRRACEPEPPYPPSRSGCRLGASAYARGSPRPRVAMMFRWISLVPPSIVFAMERKYW